MHWGQGSVYSIYETSARQLTFVGDAEYQVRQAAGSTSSCLTEIVGIQMAVGQEGAPNKPRFGKFQQMFPKSLVPVGLPFFLIPIAVVDTTNRSHWGPGLGGYQGMLGSRLSSSSGAATPPAMPPLGSFGAPQAPKLQMILGG